MPNSLLRNALFAALALSLTVGAALSARPGTSNTQPANGPNTDGLIFIPATHYKPKPTTEESLLGKKIFTENCCSACHVVDGEGGYIGPILNGIGAYRSEEFIISRLTGVPAKNSDTKPQRGVMSHVELDKTQAKLIANYLLTLPESQKGTWVKGHGTADNTGNPPQGFHYKPQAESTQSQLGQQLYLRNSCAACHQIQGYGGHLGPALDGIGARRSRRYISTRIEAGSLEVQQWHNDKQYSSFKMPATNLGQDDISKITDYLLTLPVPEK
jgi:mono/diheme cytochrome c family protein